MRRAVPLAAAATLLGGGCNRACEASRTQATATSADAAAEVAAPTNTARHPAQLAPGTARVFFGRSTTQTAAIAVEELYVVREDAGARAFFAHADADEWPASLDDAGRLRPTTAAPEPLDLTLYDDGSFAGERRYEDGSKSVWVAAPFAPVSAEQLAQPTGFEGFVATTLRYRMKLSLRGDGIEGVARYPGTREDFRIRGTLDRATRAITADELGRDGHVTGHIDAVLLGHVVPAPFSSQVAIAGTWSSPDGKRRLPMRLDQGAYPDRVTTGAGISLSAQESYARDCDRVDELVYPVLDGAPKAVTASVDAALVAIAFGGSAGRPTPGSRVKHVGCSTDPESRGTTSDTFAANLLHGSSVAIEFEHYRQEGSVSGRVWNSCVVIDLATGEIVEPAKLLDDTTSAKLTQRARKEALAELDAMDAGPDDDGLLEGMRSAAAELSLDDVPLCIEEHGVRFALVRHRVFGPDQPVFDRAEIARMLPPGKLRDLVTPSGK